MDKTGEHLLNLVASPQLEDALIDWLLARPQLGGFTSTQVSGHSKDTRSFSLVEQVTGRQQRVLFTIHAPLEALEQTVAALREEFRGTGLHYWITPLLAAGQLT